MKKVKSLSILCFLAAMVLTLASSLALAQGNGKGHGNGHGNGKHDDDNAAAASSFSDHDRDATRDWYEHHRSSLPPGLAKKDHLSPGLERQLEERGTLPPGLQKRIQPMPVDLDRRLPPPPPDCEHVVIGGHVVLMNRKSNMVLAVIHIDLN